MTQAAKNEVMRMMDFSAVEIFNSMHFSCFQLAIAREHRSLLGCEI